MKIPFMIKDKEFFIINDPYYNEYQIITDTPTPKDPNYTKLHGHFHTLAGACNFLLNREIMASDATSIQELIQVIQKAKDAVCSVYNTAILQEKDN